MTLPIVFFSYGESLRSAPLAPLYALTTLEKGVHWKLWYYFEYIALQYFSEDLPHLLTLITYFIPPVSLKKITSAKF